MTMETTKRQYDVIQLRNYESMYDISYLHNVSVLDYTNSNKKQDYKVVVKIFKYQTGKKRITHKIDHGAMLSSGKYIRMSCNDTK